MLFKENKLQNKQTEETCALPMMEGTKREKLTRSRGNSEKSVRD